MEKDFRIKRGLVVGTNVHISNSITSVQSIQFDNTTNNYSAARGELYWNSEDLTLDLNTGGTKLQIGQEQYYRIKNQTGNTIFNGQAVMANGALGSSGRILGSLARADGTFPSKFFMGIASEDISNGDDGFVTEFGLVRGIDTGMFSDADVLYVDPSVPGGLTNTAPAAPNNIITAALVVHSSNTVGSVMVRPSFSTKLQELEDVILDQSRDKSILQWSSSDSRFISISSAWETRTSNYTSTNGDLIIADTSGGSFLISLPSSPSSGDIVRIADGADWSANNLVVTRGGATIEGAAQDLTLDINNVSIDFIYTGTTWQIFPSISAAPIPNRHLEQVGTIIGGTLDFSTGNIFSDAPSVNTTYSFTNPPDSGTSYGFTLKITPSATIMITWPSSVNWPGGVTPDAPANGETSIFAFYTEDGGTNYYGFLAGKNMS